MLQWSQPCNVEYALKKHPQWPVIKAIFARITNTNGSLIAATCATLAPGWATKIWKLTKLRSMQTWSKGFIAGKFWTCLSPSNVASNVALNVAFECRFECCLECRFEWNAFYCIDLNLKSNFIAGIALKSSILKQNCKITKMPSTKSHMRPKSSAQNATGNILQWKRWRSISKKSIRTCSNVTYAAKLLWLKSCWSIIWIVIKELVGLICASLTVTLSWILKKNLWIICCLCIMHLNQSPLVPCAPMGLKIWPCWRIIITAFIWSWMLSLASFVGANLQVKTICKDI